MAEPTSVTLERQSRAAKVLLAYSETIRFMERVIAEHGIPKERPPVFWAVRVSCGLDGTYSVRCRILDAEWIVGFYADGNLAAIVKQQVEEANEDWDMWDQAGRGATVRESVRGDSVAAE